MDCSQQEDGPCYICGSDDSKEKICSCSKCGERQHLWCMSPILWKIPETWFCQECHMQRRSVSPTQVHDGASRHGSSMTPSEQSPPLQKMRMKDTKPSKVKFLPASEAALIPSDARNNWLSKQNFILERRQRDKITPSALKKSSLVKPSAPVRDFCQLTKARKEVRELKGMGKKIAGKVKPFTRQVSSSGPGDASSDKEVRGYANGSIDKVKPNLLAFLKKLKKNPVKTDAIWRGQFEIRNDPDHGIYSGLHAFTPCRINRKAYFFSLGLPTLLSFKLISWKFAWDEIFKDSPPDENAIALYILPEISDSCGQSYKHLMDMLDSHDYAMHSYIDGVELIVFTSRWLELSCKVPEGQNFLWGIYRLHKCIATGEEPSIPVNPNCHKQNVEERNTTVTVDGEEKKMKINLNVVKTEVNMMDGECIGPQELIFSKERKPFEHEETRKRIREEMLAPPGFESPLWWKKSKA